MQGSQALNSNLSLLVPRKSQSAREKRPLVQEPGHFPHSPHRRVCDDNFTFPPCHFVLTHPFSPEVVPGATWEEKGWGHRKGKETKSFLPKASPDQEKSLQSLQQRSRIEVVEFTGREKPRVNKGGWSPTGLAALYTQEGWFSPFPAQGRPEFPGHSAPPFQFSKLGFRF